MKVQFSSHKMDAIIAKHFPSFTAANVQAAANYTARVGKTYTTDTGVIAKVVIVEGQTYALLLKPEDFARGKIAAITFYRDTSNAVARRIASGQWA